MRSSKWVAVYLAVVVALFFLLSPWWGRFFYSFPYQEEVFRYAGEFDLDPYLVIAVARVESSLNPTARSPQGAVGLMQLMPETARWAAAELGVEYQPELLEDPAYNLRLGSWYLARLRRQFAGQLPLVLAAYNGGHGQVRQWLASQAWDGSLAGLDDIPFPETRQFVRRVLRDYRLYRFFYPETVHGSTSPRLSVGTKLSSGS